MAHEVVAQGDRAAEWAEYRAQVTPFELQRYLPLL
nr:glutamine synthetase [Kineococcus indalonis]